MNQVVVLFLDRFRTVLLGHGSFRTGYMFFGQPTREEHFKARLNELSNFIDGIRVPDPIAPGKSIKSLRHCLKSLYPQCADAIESMHDRLWKIKVLRNKHIHGEDFIEELARFGIAYPPPKGDWGSAWTRIVLEWRAIMLSIIAVLSEGEGGSPGDGVMDGSGPLDSTPRASPEEGN